jgi:hypothetical protein
MYTHCNAFDHAASHSKKSCMDAWSRGLMQLVLQESLILHATHWSKGVRWKSAWIIMYMGKCIGPMIKIIKMLLPQKSGTRSMHCTPMHASVACMALFCQFIPANFLPKIRIKGPFGIWTIWTLSCMHDDACTLYESIDGCGSVARTSETIDEFFITPSIDL